MFNARAAEPNQGLATPLPEHFGGAQLELAAAMRDFTRAPTEEVTGGKDLLIYVATEERSLLEVIGSLVSLLNRCARGEPGRSVEDLGRTLRVSAHSPSIGPGARQKYGHRR